ncbi:hypothetical protein BG005_007900 [Podila minutissima]|nr:hypothetical protein BG005_007900 [Podila minutissima]
MTSIPPKLTAIVQDAPGKHTATLIFMHGFGDSGAGWAPVGEHISRYAPHVKTVFPNAPAIPIAVNGGMLMPAWYDIRGSLNQDQAQDEEGMLRSRQQIMKIIREEIEEHGVPANRIVLGGFSQGCVLALLTGLTAEYNFAGLVALSGYMPMHTKIMDMVSEASKKTPIFWGHGDADQMVRYEYGRQSVELLEKHKYNVEFKTYHNMGHSASNEELRDMLEFFRKTIPAEVHLVAKV